MCWREYGAKNIHIKLKCFSTNPQSIVVDYDQGKLMSLIDLVFCSDEHLNHLLANVKGIRFRPKQINSQTAAKVKKNNNGKE